MNGNPPCSFLVSDPPDPSDVTDALFGIERQEARHLGKHCWRGPGPVSHERCLRANHQTFWERGESPEVSMRSSLTPSSTTATADATDAADAESLCRPPIEEA